VTAEVAPAIHEPPAGFGITPAAPGGLTDANHPFGSHHERSAHTKTPMYLDLFLIAVMLISGLLAMVRGLIREVLSIAGWGAAAVAGLYAYSKLLPMTKQYISNDYMAAGVTVAGAFFATLIIVSVITVKISDKILDSRIGALDRTLGFLFGLFRGLIIVVVAFIFFDWLVPAKSQPEMIRNARSRIVLQNTGDWLKGLLPEDPENTILKRLKKKSSEDQDAPEENK
jgi:membrane protein required for colicin V production